MRAIPVTIASFLEGPACDVDGSVYFSDIRANRIWRLPPGGELEVFREDAGRANGNAFDLDGRLVTCEGAEHGPGGRRRVVRADPRTGRIDVLADRFDGRRLNSPNDVVVDRAGRIYFTDPRYGDRADLELPFEGVYRVDPDGGLTLLLAQPTLGRPNGIAVAPDDRTLYVVDSHPVVGGNRKIWAFPLDGAGDVRGPGRVVCDFAPGRGGDGMAVDQQGNLYVCAGVATPRGAYESNDVPPGVYVLSPTGARLHHVPIDEDLVTNCCFGGPDLRTLYVTAGRSLYRIPTDVPGYHARIRP